MVFLALCKSMYGQPYADSNYPSQTLLKKYLADTHNISAKINTLLQEAVEIDAAGVNDALLRNQIAFALSPFASNNPGAMADLYAKYAGVLEGNQLMELSLEYTKKAWLLREKADSGRPSAQSYAFLASIAGFYFTANQNDSAYYYYTQALNVAKALQDPTFISTSFNNIGILMNQWDKQQEAGFYYNMADSLLPLKTQTDSILKGAITDNKAQLAIWHKKWPLAMELYNKNLALYARMDMPTKVLQAHCGLLNIGLIRNDLGLARKAMAAIHDLMGKAGKRVAPLNMREYFDLAEKYYRVTGNYLEALNISGKARAYADSLAKEDKHYLGGKLQAVAASLALKSAHEVELYRHDLEITRSNATKSLVITILSTLFIISLLVFFIIQLRNRQKIHQAEIEMRRIGQQLAEARAEKEELEKQKVQGELEYSKRDLAVFAQYLNTQKETYNELVERLDEIKRKNSSTQAKELHRLSLDAGARVQLQEKNSLMQENVDKINTAFLQRLQERFPNLTKAEQELCGYIRLNLSNKEIGMLKNIEPDSVKRNRNRLRNKMGLSPEEDMMKLLTEL